ncbi:MAG: pseudouridine synthase [Chloroflexi bacterium]|nr:pseudouridine synthase [Chloroflexota bacterium]MDA1146470.1 pseudouridine synthase [Chloroflexota bacterium]
MADDRAPKARPLNTSDGPDSNTPPAVPPASERLQKLLARAGFGSRRACERLITDGQVTIDGRVATLGERADPASQAVAVDGVSITLPDDNVTLVLNKPVGYVVTAAPERGQRSVYALFDAPPPQLRYVGRLDADTEGLLLFTMDGELVHRLTHPRYEVNKVYEAVVGGHPSEDALERLRRGVALEDGWTAPAAVRVVETLADETVLELTIHEGRKRQVRRMCQTVGHPVHRLRRTAFGPITLDGLATGESRALRADELAALQAIAGLSAVGGAEATR